MLSVGGKDSNERISTTEDTEGTEGTEKGNEGVKFCYTLIMGIGRVVKSVLDLCFPWSCAVCRAGYEGDGPLCADCDAKLAQLEAETHCGVCAAPLPMERSPCPYCMGKGPANFYRVVRLGPFADPLRELIHQLKYHRKWALGEELADRLLRLERVKELLHETEREDGVIIPVPLH